MEPISKQDTMMKEIQEAYAEMEELDVRWSELGLALATNRERHAQVKNRIQRLSAQIRNYGAPDSFTRHHMMVPGGLIESVHLQIRREILRHSKGVSRADLKVLFGWVSDKTLDNVIFRLCRSGEILKDENRRGYYIPVTATKMMQKNG